MRILVFNGRTTIEDCGIKMYFFTLKKMCALQTSLIRLLSFLLPSGLEVEGRQDQDNLWSLVDTDREKNTPTSENLFSMVGRSIGL